MVDRSDSLDYSEVQAGQQLAQSEAVAAPTQPVQGGLSVEKVETYNGASVKREIIAEKDQKVVLQADEEIDAILVNGDDLIIRLGDGLLIVIKGGLKEVPTLVIGDVEVPAPALKASLEAAGVTLPAAGPEDAEKAVTSSGGNFAVPFGSIGDPFAIRDLLKPTEFTRAFEDKKVDEILLRSAINSGVTISNLTPAFAGGDSSVDEAGLPNGSNGGNGTATGSGSFTISAPDGGIDLTINGVAIIVDGALTGNSVTTPLGTLTVTGFNPETGEVTYSYELSGPVNHPDGDGRNSVFDNFDVVLSDADGDATSGELSVRIVDDVPKAIDDTDAVKEDGATVATGNVISDSEGDGGKDTAGADGPVSVVWAGDNGDATIAGAHGTLSVNPDGSYSYVLDNSDPVIQGLAEGETLAETFNYTITDGDGDTSQATLTITINGTNDGVTIGDLTPRAQGGDVFFDEASLPDGSSPDAAQLTKTGSFTLSAPDGLDFLKIGGVTVISGGVFTPVTLTTALGNTVKITGFDAATGTITYSAILNDNEDHPLGQNPLFESLSIQARDRDGSEANDNLSIRIIDDEPTANDDADSVTEDGATVANGNVITGSGGNDANFTDGVKDVAGADGIASIAWNGLNEGNNVFGTYGTLTVDGNGNYTYTLNNGNAAVQGLTDGETLTETFAYTITDGDGDPSTATLTISINGSDDAVTISGLTPKSAGGDTVVDEQHLADGSSPDAGALTQPGTFTISAPDGLALLQVGGVTVITGGVFTAQTFTTPLGNTLSITGFNSITGVVSYSYTLNGNEDHSAGGGQNLFEDFGVVLTDTDGSSASNTLTVRIVDDAPKANNDLDSVSEDGALVADGNVITGSGGSDANASDGVADVKGADGPVSIAWAGASNLNTVAGGHGVLTVGTDGSYSYALNNGDKAVQGLGPNDTLTEVFNYTITDSDGDSRSATLTITINGADDGVTITGIGNGGGDEVVNEDDLQDGNSPNAAALTQTGNFTISAPDGYDDLSIGGTLVIENGAVQNLNTPIATSYGTLTITGVNLVTGVVSYSYTLSDNTLDHGFGSNGQNNIFDNIAVTLTDTDGSNATSTLIVRVIDDAPTANTVIAANLTDDEGKGDFSGLSNEGQTTAEPGDADVPGSPDSLSGPTGSLFNAGADGVLEIKIAGPAGVLSIYDQGNGVPGQEAVVYDALVTDADGNVTLTGRGSVTGDEVFQLTIRPDGSYAFTQSAALVHPVNTPANEDDLSLPFNFQVTDKDGDMNAGTLTVRVDDDTPVAGDVTRSGDEQAGQFNLMLIIDNSGSMGFSSGVPGFVTRLDVAKQAMLDAIDQYDAIGDVRVRIVTFNADGAEVGAVWMNAADAKAAILGVSVIPDAQTDYDAAIRVAKGAFADSGKFTTAGAKNVSYFLSDGDPNEGDSPNDPTPTFGLDAGEKASWEAWLNANGIVSNAIGIGAGISIGKLEPIAYNGETTSELGAIKVNDLSQLSQTIGNLISQTLVTGNLFGGPLPAASFGADGGTAVLATGGAPAGFSYQLSGGSLLVKQGGVTVLSVTLDPQSGTYEIKQIALIAHGPGVTSQLFNFNYALTDGDGDGATGKIAFTLTFDQPAVISGLTPAAQGGDATVNEANLSDGSAPNAAAVTQAGTFTITAGDGVASLTVGGFTIIAGGVFTAQSFTTPLGNTLTVTGYNSTTGVVSYSYTLGDNESHAGTSLLEDLAIVLTDTDGSTAADILSVRILDDAPTAANDTISQGGENTSITFNAFGNDKFGADGVDADNNPNAVVTFSGASLGSVSYHGATGLFIYTPNAGAEGTDSFTYTIKDGDGDTSTATVTVNLAADSKPQIGALAIVADEDNLPSGQNDIVTGDNAPSNLTGFLPINTGNDTTGSISFAGLNGATAPFASKGLPVHYSWNSGSNTLVAYTGANPATAANQVFTLQVTNVTTGAYILTLLAAVDQHAIAAADHSETANTVFNLAYVVTDSDGSTGNGVIGVTIDDDTAKIGVADLGHIANQPSAVTGDLPISFGADGGIASLASNIVPAGLSAGGEAIHYFVDPSDADSLIAYTGANPAANQVFRLDINAANDSYTFTLYEAIDARVAVSVGGSTSFGSGPSGSQILTADSTGEKLAILTGWDAAGVVQKSVNGSTAGWGVSNNNFDAGEMIRIDFDDRDFPPAVSFNGPDISYATMQFTNYSSGNQISYKVFYTDGTSDAVANYNFTSSTATLVVPSALNTKFIDYIEVKDVSGSGKFDLVDVGTVSNTGTQNLTFSVDAIDGDGDKASTSIGITIDGSNPINGTASADAMAGSSGNDTISGLGDNDDLYGLAGSDLLQGGDGNDFLAGGSGANTISGGASNDTIYFDASAFDAADKITDYVAGQDSIDLSDLFTVDTAGGQGLSNYAQMSGTNLQVDANGTAGGANWTTVATLNTSSPVSIIYDDNSSSTDHTGTV